MTNHEDDWLLYNASEYTVNGKTYRNLEAEVLYNKRLSEKNEREIRELKSGAYIVNVTGDASDPTRPASADKTWTEIWAAITENKEVICVFNYAYFRYMALGMDVTFPLIFSNNGAYTDTDRADTIQVNANNEWSRVTIATSPCTTSVIETGDKLIVGHQDANGDKVAKGSVAFDTTQTDKYLCQDGTFKTVQGGGSGDVLFKITVTQDMSTLAYSADKTYAEIQAAITAGKLPYVEWSGMIFQLSENISAMDIKFSRCKSETLSMTTYVISVGTVAINSGDAVTVSTATWTQNV